MRNTLKYCLSTPKLPRFNGNKSLLTPHELRRVECYESNTNMANSVAHPTILFSQKKAASGPRGLFLVFYCQYCKTKTIQPLRSKNTTAKYCSIKCAAVHREQIGESKKKMMLTRWGPRQIFTTVKKCLQCNKKIYRASLAYSSDKKWLHKKYCSLKCAMKWIQLHPTKNIIKGRIKAGKTKKGRPLTVKAIAANEARRGKHTSLLGQTRNRAIKQKLSKAQIKRWRRDKILGRIPRFWRISPCARKLHAILKWPERWLEKKIPYTKVNGSFQKGVVNFLAVDIVQPEVKLAIEVDGSTHKDPKQKARDAWKERELKRLGWLVLRITNEEINLDINHVVEKITYMISKLKKTTTSLPMAV